MATKYHLNNMAPFIQTRSVLKLLIPLYLLLASCSEKEPVREIKKGRSVPTLALYEQYVDSALGSTGDSFIVKMDTIVGDPISNDKYIRAYQLFLKGYKIQKDGNTDSAVLAYYDQMLPFRVADTSKYRDLLTLQQTAILQTRIKPGTVNAETFSSLIPILELNERYPSRYRWWTYSMAAKAWYLLGDYDKAESYLNSSVQSFPYKSDYGLISSFYSNYSVIELAKGNLSKALSYEDSAMSFAIKSGSRKRQATSKAAKAVLYIRMGDTARGYKLQAEAFAEKKELGTEDLLYEYQNMAATFNDQGYFKKAIELGKQTLVMARQEKNDDVILGVSEILANAYRRLKLYDSSFFYLEDAYNANIRLLVSRQTRELGALQLNYDRGRKEFDLQQQKRRASELAAKNKAQRTILSQQRIIIIGGVILFAISLALGYVLVRQARLRAAKVKAEAEKERIVLQQRLFRSQIEPHFISNTLAASVGFVRSRKLDALEDYLVKFSRLLRASLEHSMQPLIPLSEEIEALENYLGLQLLRFDGLFAYHFDLFEGYGEEDLYIPPMLLQPFVENAIYHGFFNIGYKGEIAIVIRKEEGWLHCIIDDNGSGLLTSQSTGEKRSVATLITRERLRLLSGDNAQKADLQIINKSEQGIGMGTLVIIDMPYQLSGVNSDRDTR